MRDAASSPVTGADVLLGLNAAATDAAGRFAYSDLLPGTYVISIQDAQQRFDCREVTLDALNTTFTFVLPASEPGMRVCSVAPPLNEVGTALDVELALTFCAALDPTSVSAADFTIAPDIGEAAVDVEQDVIRLRPLLQLPPDQLVLIELSGEILGQSGSRLAHPVRWRFRTAAQDTFPPRLLKTDPAAAATDYPPNLGVRLEYSEPLAEADAGLSVTVSPLATLSWRTASRSLIIDALGGWANNTTYTIQVTGVADLKGNRDATVAQLQFTTGDEPAPYHDRQPDWNRVLDAIVFASNRLGSYDIYSIKTDGSQLLRLTSLPGDELNPTLSSDGALLAYQRRGELNRWDICVQANSSDAEPVAVSSPSFNDTDPFFSRTFSDAIVFVSDRAEPTALFLMNSDGSTPVEQDTAFGSQQSQPVLHPLLDGQILFTSGRSGSQDVWRKTVSAVDGTALNQNLTADSLADEHSPSWAPDAGSFVFISDQNGTDNLWLAEATGDFARQVTYFERAAADPAVSPTAADPRCVVSLANADGGSDLVLVDLVTGEIVQVLTGKGASD